MFHNDDEGDSCFNLDEVFSSRKQVISSSSSSTDPFKPSQVSFQSSQVGPEDWGNDDDDDLELAEIDETIEATCKTDQSSSNSQNVDVQHQEVAHVLPEEQGPCIRKFPGPAGIILNLKMPQSNLKAVEQINQKTSEVNMDQLYSWSKAVSLLELGYDWRMSKHGIKSIQSTYLPCSYVSIKVPLLVIGLKSIQSVKADLNCIVQDATGETRATIHQAVVEEHGKKIKAGAVLLLRRPAVLISGPCPHLVTVTKKSLMAIVSDLNGELKVTRCSHFSRSELQSWNDEGTECEELSQPCDDESMAINHPGPRLFSTASPVYSNSRLKAPTSRPIAAARSVASPLQRPPPSNHSGTYNSRLQSTSSPSPSTRTPPVANNISKGPQTQPAAGKDHFMDDFLDGLDTDALFDDF